MKQIGMKQTFNSVSIVVVALLSLCHVQLTFAQLNTFEAGQPIRASEMNHNFEVVQEQIQEISTSSITDAGCSATQQENSVLIECSDGTSGVIAGAGTVVAYPEGGVIGQSPIKSWSTGDIVFQDSQGVTIAEASSIGDSTIVVLDGYKGTFYNDDLNQSVQLTGYGGGADLYYLTDDCSGQVFVQDFPNPSGIFYERAGTVYIWDISFDGAEILFGSKQRSGSANFSRNTYFPVGTCITGQFAVNARPAVTYTPAPEILNAAYPVRLEQLP